MPREVDALDRQSGLVGHVQVEHRQGHRQSLAPLDHRYDVGVGEIVVVDQVAVQPEVAGHGLGEGFLRRLALQAFSEARGGLPGQGPGRLRVAVGVLMDRAEQRRFQQRKAVVRPLPELGQRTFSLLAGHVVCSTSTDRFIAPSVRNMPRP